MKMPQKITITPLDTVSTDMLAPTIHLNGSSQAVLSQEWWDFYRALQNVLEQFPVESFHGRNHYVKGTDVNADVQEWKKYAFEVLSTLEETAAEVIGIIED